MPFAGNFYVSPAYAENRRTITSTCPGDIVRLQIGARVRLPQGFRGTRDTVRHGRFGTSWKEAQGRTAFVYQLLSTRAFRGHLSTWEHHN